MKVQPISFRGKIIDSHVHAGHWQGANGVVNYTNDIDTFTKQPLENGDTVEKVIVSNLDCMVHTNKENEPIRFMSNEYEGNMKMLNLSRKNPHIIPLATCQPGYGDIENLQLLIDDFPKRFAGLKFHPEQLQIPADDKRYEPYMKLAQKKKIPCLFHSGQSYDVEYSNGYISRATKYSKPEQIYATAKKFPTVPVIMAHMGGNEGENTLKAVDCIIESVQKNDAKLYADISWVDCDNPEKPTLKEAIKRLKKANALDRIMFGSDAPLGRFGAEGENGIPPLKAYTDNIVNTKNMIKTEFNEEAEEIIDKIFYKNAEDLFFKKERKTPNIKISKAVIGAVILVGAIVSGAAYLLNQNKKQEF